MKYFKIIGKATCPFCVRAKVHLEFNKLPFEYCLVDNSKELLDYYKTIYKHNTVPIIILKEDEMDDQFIGGYTELVSFLERQGFADNSG